MNISLFEEFLALMEAALPESIQRLGKPLPLQQIKQVSFELPQSIIDILTRVNGEKFNSCGGIIFGGSIMSLEEIVFEHEGCVTLFDSGIFELDAELEDERVSFDFVHPCYLPFVKDDCGNFVVVDTQPSQQGVMGQIVIVGADLVNNEVIAESMDAFFVMLIEQLKLGNHHIYQEDGCSPVLKFTDKNFSALTKVVC